MQEFSWDFRCLHGHGLSCNLILKLLGVKDLLLLIVVVSDSFDLFITRLEKSRDTLDLFLSIQVATKL